MTAIWRNSKEIHNYELLKTGQIVTVQCDSEHFLN